MPKNLLLSILLPCLTTLAWAQGFPTPKGDFGTQWIHHPAANDSTEVLFRHVYTSSAAPRQAAITVATTGKMRVYFNERNVSRELFLSSPRSSVQLHTFDVSRYLRPDSNVIAVWVAPIKGHPVQKQLSLEYYGSYDNQGRFHHRANQAWSSLLLPHCHATDSTETFDAREVPSDWKSTEYAPLPGSWTAPQAETTHSPSLSTWEICPADSSLSLLNILQPIALQEDAHGIYVSFGRTFEGSLRITLRDAKKGEEIYIDGFTYICQGELDEQAFRYFSQSSQSTFYICGDERFDKKQIQRIEGLETRKVRNHSYLYP